MAPPSATDYINAMKNYYELKEKLTSIKQEERKIWIQWKKAETLYNQLKDTLGVPATIDLTLTKPE